MNLDPLDIDRIRSYNEDALDETIEDLRTTWKYRNKPTKWIPYPKPFIKFNVRRIRHLRAELEVLRLQ